jgi:hypothetical protein
VIDSFHKDENVRVFPHGDEGKAAVGKIVAISENQRSIAVGFEHIPPFAFDNGPLGVGINPEHGAMFFAYRHEVGPWVEMMGMGHYEIERLVS